MWVRFQRLKGHECLYVAGDDAHGTPIMLKAEELEISPEALIKKVYKEHLKDLNAFLISYDNYYTTHSPENKILSEQIFNLADQKGLIEKKEIKQLFDTKK
jgi:methionyl-tRNA synthetase